MEWNIVALKVLLFCTCIWFSGPAIAESTSAVLLILLAVRLAALVCLIFFFWWVPNPEPLEEPDFAHSEIWRIWWFGVAGIWFFTKHCCTVREV
jgi:hypothetical protein